jgi:two-component system sensor histidine kinase KdpD
VLEGREITLDLPQDPPLVRCDEAMIEQVLFNLVENAQKHTPPNTPIRIAVKVWPALLEVRIADTGPGLPPGEEDRVFEKFHRVSAESAQSGFGLGLTICKAIVDAHGGAIRARNLPEGGAEFSFTLPRETAPDNP